MTFPQIIKVLKMKLFFSELFLPGWLLYQDMHGSIKKGWLGPVMAF
jgi:hypothetical protein